MLSSLYIVCSEDGSTTKGMNGNSIILVTYIFFLVNIQQAKKSRLYILNVFNENQHNTKKTTPALTQKKTSMMTYNY